MPRPTFVTPEMLADAPITRASGVSRREFLRRTSVTAGALAAIPILGLPKRATASAPDTRAFGPTLDNFMRGKMRSAYLPSVAAAVVHGQTLRWSKGYGWANLEADVRADADTVYLLASISKTFIVAAVMQMWEAGSLDLDADINTYLPFDVRNPHFPGQKITLRMLLTHTSSIKDRYSFWGPLNDPTPTGYTHGDSPVPLSQAMTGYLQEGGEYYKADGNFYTTGPGKAYHYSNLGADTAAYIVEVMSGTLFSDFVNDNLLTPLGMTQSGYHLSDITTPNRAMPYHSAKPPTNHFKPYFPFGVPDYPCACMRTSSNALSIWLRTFMNGGTFEGTQVLKSTSVNEIFRPQVPGNKWDQGLIWYRVTRGGERLIGHGGSDYGVHTNMYFSMSRDVGVITLTNRYIGGWTAYYDWLDIENRLFEIA